MKGRRGEEKEEGKSDIKVEIEQFFPDLQADQGDLCVILLQIALWSNKSGKP